MMVRLRMASVALFSAACLSACGGGGQAAFTPALPPAPSNQYASFATLSRDQQIALTGGSFTRTDPGTGGAATGDTTVTARTLADGNLSISYNAASGTYTVRDGSIVQSFGPSDRSTSALPFDTSFTTYSRSTGGVGGGTTTLALYKPGGTGDDVPLTYTTLVAFTNSSPDPANPLKTVKDTAWGAGGFATLAADMPRTGSATYSGPLRGQAVNGATIDTVTGSARLVADFATARVQTDLVLNRIGQSALTLSGAGTLQSNRFGGTLTAGSYSGTFDGGFFGPQAEEMGLGFIVRGTDGTQIAGAAAGRK